LTLAQLALGRKKEALRARALSRVALTCGVLSLVAGLVSFGVHLLFGHGASAPEPMRVFAFLGYHKAYWAVAILAALSFYSSRCARRYANQAANPMTTSSSVNGR